ncbi:MAG: hypothetical protein CL808_03175 [Citromicrobium sp.]|nr:hypothetical protein [Citromicrobium sp.]
MKKLLATSAILMLAGCAPMAAEDLPPSPVFAQPDLQAIKAYMGPDDPIKGATEVGAPVAYILLDDNDRGRNIKVCRAFEKLASESDLPPFGAQNTYAPTFWMLTTDDDIPPIDMSADEDDRYDERCDFLVDNFDHTRAGYIAQAASVPKLSSVYLVATDSERVFWVRMDSGSQDDLDGVMNYWFAGAARSDLAGVSLLNRAQKLCNPALASQLDAAFSAPPPIQPEVTVPEGADSVDLAALQAIASSTPAGIRITELVTDAAEAISGPARFGCTMVDLFG